MVQWLALVWKGVIRSFDYNSFYCDHPHTAAFRITQTQKTLVTFGQIAPAERVTITKESLEDFPTTSSRQVSPAFLNKESFCIPIIIVTPPPSNDDIYATLNAVPTPQDAAFGDQLTVPDPEFQVINCRGHGGCFSDSTGVDEWDLDLVVHGGISNTDDAVKRELTSIGISQRNKFEDDEDIELDLGPTWSG